jgi:predicted nuclease of predicted toxin-antitoxin system
MKLKLLFDENISYKLCHRISDIFPNSSHIKTFQLEQADDIQIWEFAKRENFIIVTQDSDFNVLSSLHDFPPHIIWLRTGNTRLAKIEWILRKNYESIIEIVTMGKQGVIEIDWLA